MNILVVFFVLSGLNVCLCSFNWVCSLWDVCSFLSWGPWGQCSSTCGQGVQHRLRGLCCLTEIRYNNQSGCDVTQCGRSGSEYHDYKTCSRGCCNDGVPDNNGQCACLLGFDGNFCENLSEFNIH